MSELRPNAVALVDWFDVPDRLLDSCLGWYDGQVYDALYEYAKSSSLNKEQVEKTLLNVPSSLALTGTRFVDLVTDKSLRPFINASISMWSKCCSMV